MLPSGLAVGNLRSSMEAWLAAAGVAVLDVQVDPEEEPQKPEELKAGYA